MFDSRMKNIHYYNQLLMYLASYVGWVECNKTHRTR